MGAATTSLGQRLTEALLPPDRAALHRTIEEWGFHHEGWATVDWLRMWAESRAIPAEADRIQAAEGCARGIAVSGACIRFGVDPETFARRIRRARADSMNAGHYVRTG